MTNKKYSSEANQFDHIPHFALLRRVVVGAPEAKKAQSCIDRAILNENRIELLAEVKKKGCRDVAILGVGRARRRFPNAANLF